jgi:pimeloyl-ACP methyl ester carboxylesterase
MPQEDINEQLLELPRFLETHQPAAWRSRFTDFSLGLLIGDQRSVIHFSNDISVELDSNKPGDIELCISEESWRAFLRTDAPVGAQSLTSMHETEMLDIEGNLELYFRHLLLLEGTFQSLRKKAEPAALNYATPIFEPVRGGYIRMNINGIAHRIYYEEAGEGIPLLCLHTAGADGRQYREILNDPDITSRFRVISFDLPWHGKSSPPVGYQKQIYKLTTDLYVDTVMAVKNVLQLENPVVMGCSIGGRAVLHLALRFGEEFRAAIGLQSATHASNRFDHKIGEISPLWRPDIHGGEAAAGLMEMLIASESPDQHKWETLWHYMQGGPGVFAGDLFYYSVDGDMRNGIAEQIDTAKCPLYLLTGEYDVSATPALTQELAKLVKAQYFKVMQGIGHFPMSENPDQFLQYLKPVLSMIETPKN